LSERWLRGYLKTEVLSVENRAQESTALNGIPTSTNSLNDRVTLPEKDLHPNSKPVSFDVMENGCWRPTCHIPAHGLVQVRRNGKPVYVRRLVYEHFNGSIPDGHRLVNTCESRWCCNPEHLEAKLPVDISGVLGKVFTRQNCED
jgi:HNH endonuclease